jgi:hypothetical protein
MNPEKRDWQSAIELLIVMVVILAFTALVLWFFLAASHPLVAPSAGAP